MIQCNRERLPISLGAVATTLDPLNTIPTFRIVVLANMVIMACHMGTFFFREYWMTRVDGHDGTPSTFFHTRREIGVGSIYSLEIGGYQCFHATVQDWRADVTYHQFQKLSPSRRVPDVCQYGSCLDARSALCP